MKNDEEKLIKLIININELKEAEFNSIDNQVDVSYIISFSEFLNKEFSAENLQTKNIYMIFIKIIKLEKLLLNIRINIITIEKNYYLIKKWLRNI